VRNLLIRLATEAMKLCCVQLFNHGSLADVPLIRQAKESSWDAHFSINVQLLCGAGVTATKAFLANHPENGARQALDYLIRREAAGDFDGFFVAEQSAWYHTLPHRHRTPRWLNQDHAAIMATSRPAVRSSRTPH
jgi:hypothetical protein